jgi:uncharacterized membrane protein YkoI
VRKRTTKVAVLLTALAAVGGGAAGVAAIAGASGSSGTASSRLDDGKNLVSQAKVSESQAIAAAQTAASGSLNEVDLEHYNGRLVYNVDVGSHDVKVDATTGQVVASNSDD